MKRLLCVLFVLFFATATLAAQDPTPPAAQDPQSQKTIEQVIAEWRQQDRERDLKYLADYRKEAEAELAEYNGLIATRDGELTEKLKRALDDGDETLIEVALDAIHSNKGHLQFSAELIVKEDGKNLLDKARSAYRNDFITEEQYTEHLNFFRSAKMRTEETVPAELTAMIETAKEKVPEYFARLERVGRKF